MTPGPLSVIIFNRDFTQRIAPPSVTLVPRSYSWSALGGPDKCKITVYGPAANVWEMLEYLRSPVEIRDWRGTPVWWGYAHGITVRTGAIEITYTLDGMANTVAVAYNDQAGQRSTTTYLQESTSEDTYGTKELLASLADAGQDAAEAYRAALLAQLYKPQAMLNIQPGMASLSATLDCRGWWHTLDWQYYAQSNGVTYNLANGNGTQNFGNVAATTRIAQSFQVGVAQLAGSASVFMRKQAAPADNVTIAIYSDVAGAPGVSLGSATIAAANIGANFEWIQATFATPFALAAATTYWLVISRSGALDATNYYVANADESLSYTGGALRVYNGAAWVARSPDADLLFQVVGVKETTDIITDILTASAEFLTGRIDPALSAGSGVYAPIYRAGDTTALAEILALLRAGTSNNRRLLATVAYNRELLIYEEPEHTVGSPDYFMPVDGMLKDSFLLDPGLHTCPVAGWCELFDVIPASVDTSALKTISGFFIEKSEYNPATGQLNIEPRMPGNPWDVGGYDQG